MYSHARTVMSIAHVVGDLNTEPEKGTRCISKRLLYFFASISNSHITGKLSLTLFHRRMHLLGRAETRVLRLSCDSLFQSWMYRPQELLARGVHANVHRCLVPIELKIRFRDDAVGKMTPAPATISCAHTTDRVFWR